MCLLLIDTKSFGAPLSIRIIRFIIAQLMFGYLIKLSGRLVVWVTGEVFFYSFFVLYFTDLCFLNSCILLYFLVT